MDVQREGAAVDPGSTKTARGAGVRARQGGRRWRRGGAFASAVVAALAPALVAIPADADGGVEQPELIGRAVLPVETYAPGPPAGAFFGTTVTNEISFPLPSQPVEGFSAVIDGRRPGELLAMPDNGFGTKLNSFDFLIRAYYITPDFETRRGGSGTVEVGGFISFRDPLGKIGFPIINEGTTERLLTGADIDPESLQRGKHGDLWVGDEFGPWILHFDRSGVLLDPPFAIDGLMSPNNPFLGTGTATQPNSRGFEAMAISPDGKRLYAALEGATVAEAGSTTRRIYEFDTRTEGFTGRTWTYLTEAPDNMIADMDVLTPGTFAVIERDGGRGPTAMFRNVYAFRLGPTDTPVTKELLVDLDAHRRPGGDLAAPDPRRRHRPRRPVQASCASRSRCSTCCATGDCSWAATTTSRTWGAT